MKQYVFSDDLLKKLMTEACEKDLNEYTAYGVADGQNSEYGNGDRMFAVAGGVPVQAASQRSGKRLRTVIRRVVLLVAVALLVVASTISAVERKDNWYNRVVLIPDSVNDSVEVSFKSTSNISQDSLKRMKDAVHYTRYEVEPPEGYVETQPILGWAWRDSNVYVDSNSDSGFLSFEQTFAEEFKIGFETPEETQYRSINNSPGVALIYKNHCTLVWSDGIYGFCLSGFFSEEELLEIAATCKKVDE